MPKEQFNKISNIFKKNNLQILNFFCSSYVKSLSYINSLNEYKIVSFLDIGYKRSTLLLFKNKKLISLNTIPIGGNHITNDISEVLKLNINDSEKIKKAFNKSESEFSYVLKLISKYKIVSQCYQKAEHFINLASNSLSIFENTEEKKILENLTSFSLERSF